MVKPRVHANEITGAQSQVFGSRLRIAMVPAQPYATCIDQQHAAWNLRLSRAHIDKARHVHETEYT